MQKLLPDAPLDIIGDVHGESVALKHLLFNLGYDEYGCHPKGRKVIFVGDLFDRGPDSPAVLNIARRIVEEGNGEIILGNHELNLLRGDRKDGNDWFWDESSAHDQKYEPFNRLHNQHRDELLRFLKQLPLVLERDDLRIAHAAWHEPSVQKLVATEDCLVTDLFDQWDREIDTELEARGLLSESGEEAETWKYALTDPQQNVPLLKATGLCDERRQMDNPVRVLTSGLERLAAEPFYTSGKWRFSNRVKWWDEYTDSTPVIVGHYWRQFNLIDRKALGKGDQNLFEAISPTHWHGAQGNVFCVDFSVGGRFQERKPGKVPGSTTKLAALQWPERTLVLDTGEKIATKGFGEASRE